VFVIELRDSVVFSLVQTVMVFEGTADKKATPASVQGVGVDF
jgi:hypothetical protein